MLHYFVIVDLSFTKFVCTLTSRNSTLEAPTLLLFDLQITTNIRNLVDLLWIVLWLYMRGRGQTRERERERNKICLFLIIGDKQYHSTCGMVMFIFKVFGLVWRDWCLGFSWVFSYIFVEMLNGHTNASVLNTKF